MNTTESDLDTIAWTGHAAERLRAAWSVAYVGGMGENESDAWPARYHRLLAAEVAAAGPRPGIGHRWADALRANGQWAAGPATTVTSRSPSTRTPGGCVRGVSPQIVARRRTARRRRPQS